jgi:DNA-binding transcriptional regulator Cro
MSDTIHRVVQRVIAALGGRRAAAEKLDVTPAAVSQWKSRGLPMHQIALIADLSGLPADELWGAVRRPTKRGPKGSPR